MHNAPNALASNCPSTLVAFDTWLHSLNLTRVTGFRYRKQGLIHAINIHGRLYLTTEEIARFEARAIAGEFHKEVKTPARNSVTVCAEKPAHSQAEKILTKPRV